MNEETLVRSEAHGLFRDEKHLIVAEPSENISIQYMRYWDLYQLQSVQDISDTISWYALIKPRKESSVTSWIIEVGFEDDSRIHFTANGIQDLTRQEIIELIQKKLETEGKKES